MITRVKGSTFNTDDNLHFAAITDYGAIGDGVTDCTDSILLAIATGNPVYIPTGTYLTDPIYFGSTLLFGEGNSSILKLNPNSGSSLVTLSGGTISNLKLDCNATNQSSSSCHGITIQSITATVEDVSIYWPLGNGILIDTTLDQIGSTKILNCEILGAQESGIRIIRGYNIFISDCSISQNLLGANPQNGITILPTDPATFIKMASITNCSIYNNLAKGIFVSGLGSKNVENVIIANCNVSNNASHGIHVMTAQQVLCHGNVVKSNLGDGIRLEGDTIYCRISGTNSVSNTLFGAREVIAGSIPNFNIFYYNVVRNNGNDTVTTVGANSLVV